MAAKPPAPRKPARKPKPLVDHEMIAALGRRSMEISGATRERSIIDPAGTFEAVCRRVAGIEARVKAEARIANERLSKIEARLDRIASALHRLIAARENTPPSDSENE